MTSSDGPTEKVNIALLVEEMQEQNTIATSRSEYTARVVAFADLYSALEQATKENPEEGQIAKISDEESIILEDLRKYLVDTWEVNIPKENIQQMQNEQLRKREQEAQEDLFGKESTEMSLESILWTGGFFNSKLDHLTPKLGAFIDFVKKMNLVLSPYRNELIDLVKTKELLKPEVDKEELEDIDRRISKIPYSEKRHIHLFGKILPYFNIRSATQRGAMKKYKQVTETLENAKANSPSLVQTITSTGAFLDSKSKAADHMMRRYFMEAKEDDGNVDEVDMQIGIRFGELVAGYTELEVNELAAQVEIDYNNMIKLSKKIRALDMSRTKESYVSKVYSSSEVRAELAYEIIEHSLVELTRAKNYLDRLLGTRTAILKAYADGLIDSEELPLLELSAKAREVPRDAFNELIAPYLSK